MIEKCKLAYMVSHPIQYQAPMLRRLAQEPDIDLKVFFWSDLGVREYVDQGFGGVRVKWDIPLLEGYEHEFLPIIRSSGEQGFSSPINRGFYRALKNGKFDALWLHGYWSLNSLLAMTAAKALGIPVLQRTDGTLIDRPRSGFKRRGKRLFFSVLRHLIDGVLPVGKLNQEYWEHYLGRDFPSFLAPYAVDNEYFQKSSITASRNREELRRQLNLDAGRPVILYASKLMERKRCIDLINAYLAMRPGTDGQRPYLLIVGDGTERSACEARVKAVGDANVRFLGFQNQSRLPEFYDLCDFFVLPSVHEPFALIVNEVMNAGRAVVVSDEVGCQPDLVTDGFNGKVYPARDVGALRTALEELVSDPEQTRLMGQRGLEIIKGWSFEEDIRAARKALHHVAGLPLTAVTSVPNLPETVIPESQTQIA